jgi:hypothetical protein
MRDGCGTVVSNAGRGSSGARVPEATTPVSSAMRPLPSAAASAPQGRVCTDPARGRAANPARRLDEKHTIEILPGIPNAKEGASFFHMTGYDLVR